MAVHSVSDVNRYLKDLLAGEPLLQGISVRGEISNFKQYPSGHCYFTLKDTNSALKCVMFRSRAQYLRFLPQNGMQVVAGGSIAVYERDGVYQLYVDSLIPEGTGDLALAFEQLKEKLAAEGLFDPARKQPLPAFPKKIGVVTSSAGAVLRDIYRVSKRRWPGIQLVLYPVQVQGEGAAEQIARGIDFFAEEYAVDVIIAGRGGGSMEDLWAFNEEPVVRAIAACPVPLISAVGHETDFSISDMVADLRVETPTAAAAFLIDHGTEQLALLDELQQRIVRSTQFVVQSSLFKVQGVEPRITRAAQLVIQGSMLKVESIEPRFARAVRHILESSKLRVQSLEARVAALDPELQLRRGYSLTYTDDGRLVRSVADVHEGDTIKTRIADGDLLSVLKSADLFGKQ